jgi:hypothetical protein
MKPLSEYGRFRAIKAVVCAFLLVSVLIIVIAPQVDLPPTALPAAHRLTAPLLIQLSALALLVFTVLLPAGRFMLGFTALRETTSPPLLSPLSILCVLLC